ncbi:unnamed protein product [Microthlaspi erraticum]|uniref:Knottin scorpion toxin-like domain-containing protein n=1 Tax=Microthlaspi erraticum TaxID=1685480 RepID=A0A6D2K5J7_9BRAS|nr:unnamed protein product [Microthlaspi erraticum]
MTSLMLSKVAVAAVVVVCFSVLFLSPTEVEGACDIPNGVCYPGQLFQDSCSDRCKALDKDFYDGTCTPRPVIMDFMMDCMCCM